MKRKTLFLAALIAATLAVMVAGCGKSKNNNANTTTAPPATGATSPAAKAGSSLALSANPSGALTFDKTKLASKAGTVTFKMSNPSSSGIQHGIAVEGNGVDKDGPIVQPGKTSTLAVKLKPGKYAYYCPFDAHKQQGMTGTLTVK